MPSIGENLSVVYSKDIIHAAYLKHAYIHAAAHSRCNTQVSSILVSRESGILLASTNVYENEWYSFSSIQSIIFKSALRGMSCYGLDLYTPLPPSKLDTIMIRECGIETVIYHKEFTDMINEPDKISLDFLSSNNVKVIEWSGKVSKKPLNLMVRGESFNP